MNVYHNDTKGGLCIQQDTTYYTPEELMSMLLNYAKEIVHHYGGKRIRDCVITVPSFFTQHERRAVFTAAEIADVNVRNKLVESQGG
jgi:molecular chaperone DnaK (HSP70)